MITKLSKVQLAKKQARVDFSLQMAALLKAALSQNRFTDEFINLGTSEHFFDDSCAAVGLRARISTMITTLEGMAEMESILIDTYYNE